ncbi:MAG: aminomethyl-transferring glycine dehydrogenase subunit GcvPA [Candidatus Omnitrophica bacterium]|nr:aminomethyl-transferring glycine dehydrogenase subunit GcvPA [Candidatus Omnitrophota bacterium]
MHFHPLTDADKDEMLKEIGVSGFNDLLQGIPSVLRHPKLDIPAGLSEFEVQNLLKERLGLNQSQSDLLSFLGGGSYDHFIPSAVAQIISRNEFYTAYTPYQPEASQGTLQTIFEYQSLISELTGLDVANASHYDGATAVAEAVLLALRHTGRSKILVSSSLHPHYRQTIRTYLKGTPYIMQEFAFDENGQFSREDFMKHLDPQVGGAIFQTPNFFGVVENLMGVSESLHEAGALLIMASHPLSLSVFKSPGEWGADVAVGEGQPLGLTTQYGGPYLGYFAVARSLMRKIPGRLVGITQDSKGRRAYVLTLKAREQDIRRERASSNICTNQALCALTACVYMTLMGTLGIREVAEINLDRAYYLRAEISKLPGFHVNVNLPIFNEFVVRSDKPFARISEILKSHLILPGINLDEFYPEMKNHFLVCATETKTKGDLDRYVEALSQC